MKGTITVSDHGIIPKPSPNPSSWKKVVFRETGAKEAGDSTARGHEEAMPFFFFSRRPGWGPGLQWSWSLEHELPQERICSKEGEEQGPPPPCPTGHQAP